MREVKILTNLRDPLNSSIFLATSLIFFSLSYLVMATLPGEHDNMCVIGGALTLKNIAFAVILSLAIGLMLAGFTEMIRTRSLKNKLAITSLSGSAFVLGLFTLFCALCTLPLISFFGVSISLWFFTEYVFLFQIVSLIFMSFALYLMEYQLKGVCFSLSIKQRLKRLFKS